MSPLSTYQIFQTPTDPSVGSSMRTSAKPRISAHQRETAYQREPSNRQNFSTRIVFTAKRRVADDATSFALNAGECSHGRAVSKNH
jgi:hypothetical protein